jgi:predicted site-specific integrase-resolvase
MPDYKQQKQITMNKKEEIQTQINKDDLVNEVKELLDVLKKEIKYYVLNNRKNERLYNRKELAEYLKVAPSTIINWSSRGIITPIFIQSKVYYKASEIDEILNN